MAESRGTGARMFGFIDNLTATEDERRLARTWADFAMKRFGNSAAEKLRDGLNHPGRIKSRRALRIAIRRAEARIRTTIEIATR